MKKLFVIVILAGFVIGCSSASSNSSAEGCVIKDYNAGASCWTY